MNPKTLETIQTIHPTSKTLYSLNHWYSKYMKTAKNKSTKIKVLKTGFPTSFRESLGATLVVWDSVGLGPINPT